MKKIVYSQNYNLVRFLVLSLVMAVLLIPAVLCFAGTNTSVASTLTTTPVDVSEDGRYVLTTSSNYDGLVLFDKQTGKSINITNGNKAGYYATISPNSQYVGYKAFMQSNGGFLQKAMLYDITQGKAISLTDWVPLTGTPAVAADGTIAVTVGNQLQLLNKQLKIVSTTDLGQYINLVSFSPDSSEVIYCNENQQVVLLNRANQKQSVAATSDQGLWGAKFSPKGDKIMVSTVVGNVGYAAVNNGQVQIVGKGQALGWVDNNTVAYLQKTVSEATNSVTKSTLVLKNAANNTQSTIDLNQGDAEVAVKGANSAVVRSGQIEYGSIASNQFVSAKRFDTPALFQVSSAAIATPTAAGQASAATTADTITPTAVVNQSTRVYLSGVPYIHQVYDTQDNFNGSSACNATAALMAIEYYNILPTHPITVSTPNKHTSNYGWYICNVYTKGRTFNIYSPDPSGNSFAGGFGYITENNWADTKDYLADYIRYHGRSSSVDWSPSWTKLQTEINNNHPFVVLTSLSSAGHYITGIGYLKNQHTAIFNDPYGDKNKGYMNYAGGFVYYDWPGYNNGYSNLNTAWCFIYAR